MHEFMHSCRPTGIKDTYFHPVVAGLTLAEGQLAIERSHHRVSGNVVQCHQPWGGRAIRRANHPAQDLTEPKSESEFVARALDEAVVWWRCCWRAPLLLGGARGLVARSCFRVGEMRENMCGAGICVGLAGSVACVTTRPHDRAVVGAGVVCLLPTNNVSSQEFLAAFGGWVNILWREQNVAAWLSDFTFGEAPHVLCKVCKNVANISATTLWKCWGKLQNNPQSSQLCKSFKFYIDFIN